MGKIVRIVLVEDHTILREGLRALLSADPKFEIVGEADDGREAVRRKTKNQPGDKGRAPAAGRPTAGSATGGPGSARRTAPLRRKSVFCSRRLSFFFPDLLGPFE